MAATAHPNVPAGAQMRGTAAGRPQGSGAGRQIHGQIEGTREVAVAMNNSERRCAYDGDGQCQAYRAKETAFCIGHARKLGLV
jgi:hypothetical protein